jgi:serine/threonine protein kinase
METCRVECGVTTWFKLLLRPGAVIRGKWQRHEYKIIRLLGSGTTGSVYLVERKGCSCALKIATDGLLLQAEINTLRALVFAPEKPYLLDVDDWQAAGETVSFFVMPYFTGEHLREFIRRAGIDWLPALGLQVLHQLAALHAQGYIFGDLKSENMKVSPNGCVRLLDYGGACPFGRSVKQLSELYDRGYWQAGSRRADGAYDLFAFAVMCLECVSSRALHAAAALPAARRNGEALLTLLMAQPRLHAIAPFLRKALLGQFADAQEAYEQWRSLTMHWGRRKVAPLDGKWLKIAFTSTILIFIFVFFYMIP